MPSEYDVDRPPAKLDTLAGEQAARLLPLPDLHIPAPAGTESRDIILGSEALLDRQDLVVLLGDVVANYGAPGEYERVNEVVGRLDRPYAATNGNHEVVFEPYPRDHPDHGDRYDRAAPATRAASRARFERFFGVDRFEAAVDLPAAVCLLGMDDQNERRSALLDADHEQWFRDVLARAAGKPLVVLAHYPLVAQKLDRVTYHEEAFEPYYRPPEDVRETLRDREAPTLWMSGHLHITPRHPYSEPYRTADGVWQVHCPDGIGHGREQVEPFTSRSYDGVFVRELVVTTGALSVVTHNLAAAETVTEHTFEF